MPILRVKRLHPHAKLPEVANPGEDLGYDLFALESTTLYLGKKTVVRTGIAAQAYDNHSHWYGDNIPLGLLIRDRSSMALKGIVTSGGVIDPGYTGEIRVILTSFEADGKSFFTGTEIKAGDKIAQMIPIKVRTGDVVEVDPLRETTRGEKGFGSSGK